MVSAYSLAFRGALLEHTERADHIHKWKSLFYFPNILINSTWRAIIVSCAFKSHLEFIEKRVSPKFKHRHLWRDRTPRKRAVHIQVWVWPSAQAVTFVSAVAVCSILVA